MIAALAFRAGMLTYAARHWLPLDRHAANPSRTQQDVLQAILRANRATQFGEEHGFGDIRSVEQFRRQVPVQDYDKLRPYVERQRLTGARALTDESPLFYAQTSGSTGTPKYIPIPPSALRMHRTEQALFTYLQYRACPEAFAGKAFGIMGAAVEGRLDSGHHVGSVSGYLYESLPATVRSRFVLPPEISCIGDYELKYLVMLRLALAYPDITYMGSPNPSTFLRLLEILNQRRDTLAHSLESGAFPEMEALDDRTRWIVERLIRPDRHRARELRADRPLSFAALWPGIRLVTTWTGGSCGIALDKLRRLLPRDTRVMELGYQSTECRGTIAIEAETPGGLPPLHHYFFEFVEQDDWDSATPEFIGLEALVPGRHYQIVITTTAGLYRYFMNDLVEVTGHYRNTPLLRFVQKGRGVTSLTGEKLYEGQVIHAVQGAARTFGLAAAFFLLVADETGSSYSLFFENDIPSLAPAPDIAAAIDERLSDLNIEYRSKRASGRLPALTMTWLKPGAGEAYKAACVRAGQREGQFKPVALQYRSRLAFDFEAYAAG